LFLYSKFVLTVRLNNTETSCLKAEIGGLNSGPVLIGSGLNSEWS